VHSVAKRIFLKRRIEVCDPQAVSRLLSVLFFICLCFYVSQYHIIIIIIIIIIIFIPWCRMLFEKLTVTQLVKKYSAFLWNPKAHYRLHTNPPLDPKLSQLNPVRPIDPYLPKIHLNVILSTTPRSSQWSLPFGPPNQNPVNTSSLPHACHMSRPPHPP
jgi:hypothetical protein